MEQKICKDCKIEKPYDQFYRRESLSDGYMTWCKLCDEERRKRLKATSIHTEATTIQHENERLFAKQLLENLGYITDNPDYPVAKQFHVKHGLPYTPKK